jgi:hypothetical protein
MSWSGLLEELKKWLDPTAIGVGIAALAGWVNTLFIILSIIWLAIRIYESSTVQGWVWKARMRRKRRSRKRDYGSGL